MEACASKFDEDTVRHCAALQGIALTEAHVAGVVANVRLIAELAQPVLAAALDVADEPAPVWRP